MRFSKVILLSAVAAVLPLASQATSVGSNPTLSISGLTFNDFSCNVEHQGVASPGGCGKIGVSTITQPGTGLQFSSGFTAGSLGFVSFDDAVINYHVNSSSMAINNVGLDFNGTFYGYAISSVTETVFNDAGQQVGFASVACGTGAGCTRTDDIMLSGSYSDLYVTKDINVSSFVGLAQISYIDQTFDGPAAPEPASFAMLGTGLLGAAGLLRRRAKAAAKKAVTA